MQLRQVTPADYRAIWSLLQPVFAAGETYAVARDICEADAIDLWCRKPDATYVAVDGETLLGTYYIKTNAAGGGAHVCNCGYVTAGAAQGRGVARQMCIHSQTEAVALGFSAMQFNLVLASNHRAVALWHRLGFETVGQLPRAFDHPEYGLVDAHVMYKWLAAGGSAEDDAEHHHHKAKP